MGKTLLGVRLACWLAGWLIAFVNLPTVHESPEILQRLDHNAGADQVLFDGRSVIEPCVAMGNRGDHALQLGGSAWRLQHKELPLSPRLRTGVTAMGLGEGGRVACVERWEWRLQTNRKGERYF